MRSLTADCRRTFNCSIHRFLSMLEQHKYTNNFFFLHADATNYNYDYLLHKHNDGAKLITIYDFLRMSSRNRKTWKIFLFESWDKIDGIIVSF